MKVDRLSRWRPLGVSNPCFRRERNASLFVSVRDRSGKRKKNNISVRNCPRLCAHKSAPYIGHSLGIDRLKGRLRFWEYGIMARRVLDRYLDSKDARRRLAPRAKPYFRTIERGLHLGYRRLANGAAGPWVARHYLGDRRYEEEAIGHADDLSDADGVAILTYWQAVETARERMRLRVQPRRGHCRPLHGRRRRRGLSRIFGPQPEHGL